MATGKQRKHHNKNKKHHSCGCCSQKFERKREFLTHEKKCMAMQVDATTKFKRKKRRGLNAAIRFGLWNSTYGERNAFGPCYCCGRDVTQQSFEAGHVISAADGGADHLGNLKVVCRTCNASMGTCNMETFKMTYFPSCSVDDDNESV